MAYYAVQNVVAVFDDTLERIADIRVRSTAPKPRPATPTSTSRAPPVAGLLDRSGVPSDRNDTVAATITLAKGAFTEPSGATRSPAAFSPFRGRR